MCAKLQINSHTVIDFPPFVTDGNKERIHLWANNTEPTLWEVFSVRQNSRKRKPNSRKTRYRLTTCAPLKTVSASVRSAVSPHAKSATNSQRKNSGRRLTLCSVSPRRFGGRPTTALPHKTIATTRQKGRRSGFVPLCRPFLSVIIHIQDYLFCEQKYQFYPSLISTFVISNAASEQR